MASRAIPLSGCRALVLVLFTASRCVGAQSQDDALPPPPDVRQINANAIYHLSLVVNHVDNGVVAQVSRRNGRFYLASADLQRAGIPADKIPPGEVDPDAVTGVKSEYDSAGQRLLVTVPDDWLPKRDVAMGNGTKRYKAVSGSGALFNYDLYTSHTQQGSSQLSAWHEVRFFNPLGAFNSTGTLGKSYGGDGFNNGYRRYDTWINGQNDDNALSWAVGDIISDALSWSSSVRMGGVSVGRDFSLRPDLVTYPLPAFSGEAAVPSTVDVFINGFRNGSTRLQPGPFTLTNLPYVNGAGEAVLVTTDALGRQVSTTLPFYVASDLLRPGFSDYSFSGGALRRNYGLKNFDYGPAAASGSWRYGVNDVWTVESHGEAAESLALGGLGSVVKLGRWGVVNGALSYSQMRGDSGQQVNWGYQYNGSLFTLATQHTHRQRGFGNLALYDTPTRYDSNNLPISTLSRDTDQYSVSLNMGDYGNMGAAWIDVQSFDNARTRLLNISWSKSLWGNSSLYLAASRDMEEGGWSTAMTLQIPLGVRDNVALSVEHYPDSGDTQRVNYSHAMPSDGGFGWDMAWAHQQRNDDYLQGTLSWRNNHVELQGGVYGQSGEYTQWGDMSGSLVWMDNKLFAANQINDAFVVVSTEGEPDVTVNYENQPIGETDDDGYMLVSSVTSAYAGLYSIETLNLPADVSIRNTERRVALQRRSGYLLKFPIEHQNVANVILHDSTGNAVPLASRVSGVAGGDTVVGYDGLAYLEGLKRENTLTVTAPDGRRCRVSLLVDRKKSGRLETYGPLICRWQEAP